VVRKQIVVIAIVLVAFGMGVLVGKRTGRPRTGGVRIGSGASAGEMKAGCVDFREARAHTGETACISGRVVRVFTSRASNTFLDFCPDYRTCPFSGVVFASDKSKFGDVGSLEGRQVEIRGPITLYQGRAEIIVHDPQQIRMVP